MAEGDEEVVNANTTTPEQAEMMRLRVEVATGVEDNTLTDTDARGFVNIVSSDPAAVFWRPVLCTTCAKPKIVHDPLQTRCSRAMITQIQRTRYELACM